MSDNNVSTEASIILLGSKVDSLIQRDQETRKVLDNIAIAVGKLAVIEERQTHSHAATERAFIEIRDLESKVSQIASLYDARLKLLENQSPINALTSSAMGKGVVAVVLLVIGAMVSSVLRTVPQQPAVMIQQAPPAQQQPQSKAPMGVLPNQPIVVRPIFTL